MGKTGENAHHVGALADKKTLNYIQEHLGIAKNEAANRIFLKYHTGKHSTSEKYGTIIQKRLKVFEGNPERMMQEWNAIKTQLKQIDNNGPSAYGWKPSRNQTQFQTVRQFVL